MPAAMATARRPPASLASTPPAGSRLAPGGRVVTVQSRSCRSCDIKLLFATGSAARPGGEGGPRGARGGDDRRGRAPRADASTRSTRPSIPMAGELRAPGRQGDDDVHGLIHKDNWRTFLDVVLPQLLDPGFREEDFQRLKDAQMNALVEDLRSNNEEELGKERLQARIFARHALRAPVARDRRRPRARSRSTTSRRSSEADYTRAEPDPRRRRRDCPTSSSDRLEAATRDAAGRVPARAARPHRGPRRQGIEVEIIAEGHPGDGHLAGLPDRRHAARPDFAALSARPGLARRAPRVERPSLPADPRGPRHELRRLRLHRGVSRAACSSSSPTRTRPARADLRDLDPSRRARRTPTWRCGSRSDELDRLLERRAVAERSSSRRATT